jgi:tRNA(Glu) U13 pseudouridine synthase TruD
MVANSMKKQKDRVTANQLEQALLEQVEYVSHMNVSRNVISNNVTFCEMLVGRLFGPRDPGKRTEAYKRMVQKVMEDARVERAEFEMRMKEQRAAQERKIVLPGQPGPRGPVMGN